MNSSPKLINTVQIIRDNLKINSVIGGSTTSRKREFATNRHLQHSRKETKNLHNNKFKVVTTSDTATLEYYQSIYTHCKQRFNILDGIEVVKKSVYQYIENHINNYLFGNYNISEVRSNLYNNLVHYSRLETEDLNSETLATYFQELNFNIIEYCEEKYLVQSQYSIDFESETETNNKGKQRLKQYSRTTPNTPILQKTTAKHLQTPEQKTSVKLPLSITSFPISLEPILTSANIIDYLQKNESNHSESLKSKETESEPEEITENKEEMATAYIAKIPEFTGEDNDTIQKAEDANGWITVRMLKAILYFLQRTAGEWFENLEESFENWQAFKDAFLQQFIDNNTSITLRNHFCNIKQEISETFIARLKNKLIKKVYPHAPADLATVIRHAKSYKMTIEEANHTKLTNSQRRLKAILQTNNSSSNNHKDINHHNDTTKTILDHPLTTNLKIVIIVEFQDTGNKIAKNCKETNKTEVINVIFHHNNLTINLYHQLIIHQDHKIKTQLLSIQQYQTLSTQQYQVPARRLVQHNQFTPQNQFQNNNNRINPNNQLVPRNSGQQRPNHYHTQPIAALKSNLSNNTIPPAQIAQNANLSDIFPFEFEANESPFLLSNAAVNEQKAITAIYTKATVEKKPIRLILDSRSAGTQTVIVTADGMKKTPVGEIDNFPFTIDRITIPVKVLVMDTPQYQALVRNDWLLKANANLDWETQELKISYQEQYTIVPATYDTFNK
ncbi:hypothetical protein G9A89_023692 [Geosiphon pyriformis]|nr:hypothetical protein G9A89_023692 [Geosiphon pyriformis]